MKSIKPKISVVAIDETWALSDSAKKLCGKLFGLYVVDENLHTHICSLTPSLALWFYDFVTELEIDDNLWSEIRECYEVMDYWSLSVMNTDLKEDVTKYHIEDFPGYEDKEVYDEWFGDIVDHYRGNCLHPENLLKIL